MCGGDKNGTFRVPGLQTSLPIPKPPWQARGASADGGGLLPSTAVTQLHTQAPNPSFPLLSSSPREWREAGTASPPFFQVTNPLKIPSLGAMKLSHFVFLVFQTLYFISPPAAEKDEQKARAGSKKSIRCRKTEDLFLFFISDAGYPGNITANKSGGYCPPAQAKSSGSPCQSPQRGTHSLPGEGLALWKMLSLQG